MNQILIFFLGVILGAGIILVFMKKRIGELELDLKRMEREIEEEKALLLRQLAEMAGKEESIASKLADFNRQMQEIKENRKQSILKELTKRGKIKTKEVAGLLEVSRATAFRYLEELEKERKIEQVGVFGRNVKYRIKGH